MADDRQTRKERRIRSASCSWFTSAKRRSRRALLESALRQQIDERGAPRDSQWKGQLERLLRPVHFGPTAVHTNTGRFDRHLAPPIGQQQNRQESISQACKRDRRRSGMPRRLVVDTFSADLFIEDTGKWSKQKRPDIRVVIDAPSRLVISLTIQIT